MALDETSFYERLLQPQATGATTPSTRPPRPSAAVVPWRRNPSGETEVYWVRRSPTMRFMGGWYAFPGGGLSRSDAALAVSQTPSGTSDSTFSDADPNTPPEEIRRLGADLIPGLVTCALRELFEETGLLLTSEPIPTGAKLDSGREQLLAKEVSFAEFLAERQWTLSAAALEFAGRWLTPPLAPMRFDNRFFLLHWDLHQMQQPSLMGSELDFGEWIQPAHAIERWNRGEATIAPPILHILNVLAEDEPAVGLRRLRDTREANLGSMRRIELRPGIVLLPLLTPTLPPATHTHAYLVGQKRAVLIDPATPHADETQLLRLALAAARDQGLEIEAIWLTHHHLDHIGAADAMRRELGIPICAHPLSARHLARVGLTVDQELHDGEVFDLGDEQPFPVRVVHTPGHTQGHLCFFVEAHRSLIAGDLVSSLSTIVIDPPEGDMDAYLESLRRVRQLRPEILFPAHGPAVLDAVRKLEKLEHHRLAREEEVFQAWQAGQRDPLEMVKLIYRGVAEEIHPVAARQLRAHTERLLKLGRITVD